jgi:hypothetical protein
MTQVFVVVAEARADFRTAADLADRVLCRDVDWISEEVLDDFRSWRGLDDSSPFLSWRQAAEVARAERIRVHGHFGEEPGEPDAQAARRALRLLELRGGQLDGSFLIRDDDRQVERRKGLEQARKQSTLSCPIVIGLAHLKRECWVLGGFDPTTDAEQERLSSIADELGFDPRQEPHRLTAKEDKEVRSAKRVLRRLTADNPEREADCWLKAPLATLQSRGQQTGLAEYLEEVKVRIVPLFTGRKRG